MKYSVFICLSWFFGDLGASHWTIHYLFWVDSFHEFSLFSFIILYDIILPHEELNPFEYLGMWTLGFIFCMI